MPINLTIGEEEAGRRLDAVISTALPEVSRSAAQQLCEKGLVLVNGVTAVKSLKLKAGDKVEWEPAEPVKLDAFAQDIPLELIYEDAHLLVVNKPQGMVVHPAPGNPDGTLVNALLFHCQGRLSTINGVIRPGIVHRIDKDTSGLLVVAKDDRAHAGLAEQFAAHSIDRVYYAVAHGRLKQEAGRVEAPLGRHPIDRKKMCVTTKNARFAATRYEAVEQFERYCLVRLTLETGRTHQIRVHMAYIGHPVAGDSVYGPAKGPPGLRGQCLHAAVLGFTHPITGDRLRFEAPLPDCFSALLTRLRKEGNPHGTV